MLYAVEMDVKKSLGIRIASARKVAPVKLTQAQLAEILEVTPQAISGWERGEAMPDATRLNKLADALGVSLLWLMQDAPGGHNIAQHYLQELSAARPLKEQEEINRRVSEQDRLVREMKALEGPVQITPGDQLVGARDFPIYAAAAAGDGYMIVHTDVMEYVKRPVILEGVPDSYGVLVKGDSMVPAYRDGDMALIHPRRPPERETDVVLYDHDHRTGDAKGLLKRLVGFNDRSYKLEQYNPAKTFSEHRADWPICHQVVGTYKGRR